ncbi:MAG: S9 family peptidase [Proteobacteria bacterium]|nr:S9 family peptidase [Pseudomonadota bacterium]
MNHRSVRRGAVPACAAPAVALIICLTVPCTASAQNPVPTAHRESGALVYEGIPPTDPALAQRLGQYLQSRSATFLDWTAGGALLIKTRFGDTEQVHQVDGPGGARLQRTFFPDPVAWARAAKQGTGFVFSKDQGGDENYQLFYGAPGGTSRALTEGAFIHGSAVWAHDGRRLAFYGNDRDTLSYDVYVTDVAGSGAPQLLVGGHQDTWYPLDWSFDDAKLLVWKYNSGSDGELFAADTTTGALSPIEAGKNHGTIRTARFAANGRSVYVLTDEDGEVAQLKLKDPLTHDDQRICPASPWEVEDFDVSADGRYVACIFNEDGRSRLVVLDTVARSEVALPGLPEGLLGNPRFDKGGTRLAMSVETATAPRDAYVLDIEHARLERWTHSEPGPLDTGTLLAPELVHFPTWDRTGGKQRTLSAWVYRPRKGGPAPVLIDIHGGPEGQARPGWDPFVQFLVNELGYAVVLPNVRGSSGYGKSFLALDNGPLREDAVRDIGSLLVWIGVQPQFDRDKVVVMGASYGGYMALAAMVAYGERLRGGIDLAGISNFVNFLSNTAGYRRNLRRAEYGDERDTHMRAFLERISPLDNAARIRKPLLVAAGKNDPKVPVSESDQLVWRVRTGGNEVWYLLARDEGHGFARKANRDAYLETAAMFLQKMAR